MTIRAWKLGGVAFALAILLPVGAAAEQADQPSASAASQPASQPSKGVQRAPKRPAAPWTIQDALPDHSLTLRQYEPPSDPGIGRVPLRAGKGSFGFETEVHMKPNETFDGRTVVQGFQVNENRVRPFMGLSLSVPTGGK